MLAAWASFHVIVDDLPLGPRVSLRARRPRGRRSSMVAVNHFLMAPMLHLANGHSLRESGLFSFQSLSTDLVLAMLGVAIAAFWHGNPWLDPVRRRSAAADPPLAVACRSSRRRRASTRRRASSTRVTSPPL